MVDGNLDLGRPHEIRLVRCRRAVFGQRHVIVRTPDLVLCAVPALREVLIASDVSTLASITSLARLGVAPSRRTTARTGHFDAEK